jgi:hypothetical protein
VTSQSRFGSRADSGRVAVWATRLPDSRSRNCSASRKATSPVAMKLSMIVEITSLTLRVTFKMAAIDAHAAPTVTAIRRMKVTWMGAGRFT